jgi:DNA polymerase zeta
VYSEFSRVFGVDFHSVLTRGSQFKVESVMFKISKPENFMLPSPSREDVCMESCSVKFCADPLDVGW